MSQFRQISGTVDGNRRKEMQENDSDIGSEYRGQHVELARGLLNKVKGAEESGVVSARNDRFKSWKSWHLVLRNGSAKGMKSTVDDTISTSVHN